jgi:hypothetical protein
MRVSRIVVHQGVSFTPGTDLMHAWLSASEPEIEAVTAQWHRLIVEPNLGEPLALEPEGDGITHVYAGVYPFFSPALLSRVLALNPEDTDRVQRRLLPIAHDSYVYTVGYGLYRRLADYRRWVSLPVLLGRFQSLYLGIGRHCRLISMNLDQSVSGILTLAGTNKAFGRDLLKTSGIPVAPGFLSLNKEDLLERAEALGYPVALKAVSGGNSESVILGIQNAADLAVAVEQFFRSDFLLVERMLEGVELRLHFIGGKLFRVFRANPRVITGDGVSTIDELLQRDQPELHRRAHRLLIQQQRLLQQLWGYGIRSMADLSRVIPEARARLRVSAAAGEQMEKAPLEALHPADREALERLLERFGEPSAGIDVILRDEGAPLSEGGAVLEINSPCGVTYLRGDQPAAADHELVGFVEKVPGFIEQEGKVPVWLAMTEEADRGALARAELESAFLQRWPEGRIGTLSSAGWLPLLTDQRAEAFLIWLTEDGVREHGMPSHLEPRLLFAGDEALFSKRYPIVSRTTLNAEGKLQPVSSPLDIQ